MKTNDSNSRPKIPSQFGDLIGTYRVKVGPSFFLPHLALLLLAALGIGAFLGASTTFEKVAGSIFLVATTLPFLAASWTTLRSIRDELSIYKNGFVYKSRKGIQECAWEEIEFDDSELDERRRIKISSVTKKNGEKITLAYKMRGRDVLDHEYFEYCWSRIPASEKARPEDELQKPRTMGSLVGTYHVKRSTSTWMTILPLVFLASFGAIALVAVQDLIGRILCPLVAILPLLIYLWGMFSGRGDEMKIYENGFSYKWKKQMAECLWEEIEDYKQTYTPFGKLVDNLASIKKQNGPWIPINFEMQGREHLIPHLRTVVKELTDPEE